jgi:putative ABC transport system permease protein
MPIVIAAPGLPPTFWAIAGAAVMPNATMFFGVPPDRALSMMGLDFRDDNGRSVSRQENQRLGDRAVQLLKQGRWVIVTDEYRQLKGIKFGDPLVLQKADGTNVTYHVAGVVWSPGVDVMVSMFDMDRQFDQRTAASVFGSIDDAARDFGAHGAYLFAANLQDGVDKEALLKNLKHELGEMGLRAGDVRQIKQRIEDSFAQLLMMASSVALAAMGVASLGVTNAVMASVRSRRWQFGVMRSVGVTRGELLRLVLAEATLLGIVGAALGLACGLDIAISASRLAANVIGYNPPLQIPWGIAGLGAGIVIAVSLLASVWPAISVARSDPLALLQAGRSAG